MKKIFFLIICLSVLVICTSALTITSVDTVDVSTKDSKNSTSWDKVESGNLVDLNILKPTSVKLTVSDSLAKEKVEPIIQVSSDSDILVKADEKYETVNIIISDKSRIEGYYTYGKNNTYPWGIYWCIHNIGEKPILVYSEFSGRKVWYAPVGTKAVESLTATLEKGELPDISIIQEAVGV